MKLARFDLGRAATNLALALTAAGVGARSAPARLSWEAIEHLPGHTPVTVMVGDNARIYFRLTPGTPVVIPIEGPARLRVVSRVELPTGSTQVVSYRVRVTDNGRELDRHDTESSASSLVRDPDARHALGKSRRMVVDVPKGTRSVALSVEGATVLVRLHQGAPGEGEEPMVSLTPVEAPRTVTVTEGEKSIAYYSVMPGKPVKLRVVGPTTLDLLARLDFDDTMRGVQTYRLVLSEGGKKFRELEFRTTKATTARYSELKDRVPSKFDRAQIAIGEGLNEIVVSLASPERGAAEIHARIPQPTTGKEE